MVEVIFDCDYNEEYDFEYGFWLRDIGTGMMPVFDIPKDAKEWFKENDITLDYAYLFRADHESDRYVVSGTIFTFENNDDALRFKLRWQ
jgi:hypothetical protein